MSAASLTAELMPPRMSSASVRSLLAARQPGYGLPGVFYTDADIYATHL
jgi:hypothetical protein